MTDEKRLAQIKLGPSPAPYFPASSLSNALEATKIQVPQAPGPLKGPLEKVYAFWIAGMSCDGCSISATGATEPAVEDLLLGRIPGLPRLILYHYVLSPEAGGAFMAGYADAAEGKLDAPYVVVFEGSIPDERLAGEGFWDSMGAGTVSGEQHSKPITANDWLRRLAPGAAAVIAIGTCATWGGIPAAIGNPTGAMGMMDFLGKDYRSAFGVPVVNIPGCAPVGDNFTEAVAAILMFLQGLGPLPEFDELGRPAWQFGTTVHLHCQRGGYYEEGVFAQDFGDRECLVELGCWGPVVNCNIVGRGAQSHMGGCMNVGGACIGCTMPGFPDKFTPFYKSAPGSAVSSTTSRVTGSVMRRLRRISNKARNREVKWTDQGSTPSPWAHIAPETPADKVVDFFYQRLQYAGGKQPGRQQAAAKYPGGYEVPGIKGTGGEKLEE